jgi:hypothetical protein
MDAAGDETSPVPLSAPPYSRPRHRRRRVQQLRRQDGRRAGSGCGALGVSRHFGQPTSSRRCLLMRAWVLSYTRDVSHTIAATVTCYLFEASRLNHGAPMRSIFLVGTRPSL